MYSFTFSQNWNNKLLMDHFTTIRPDKGFIEPGKEYPFVWKDGSALGTVRVVVLTRTSESKITDGMCYIDTGYSKALTMPILHKMHGEWFAAQGPEAPFVFCVLKVITRELNTFMMLLTDGMKRFDKCLMVAGIVVDELTPEVIAQQEKLWIETQQPENLVK